MNKARGSRDGPQEPRHRSSPHRIKEYGGTTHSASSYAHAMSTQQAHRDWRYPLAIHFDAPPTTDEEQHPQASRTQSCSTYTYKIVRCKGAISLLRTVCAINDFDEVSDCAAGANLIWQAGKLRSHEAVLLEPHQRINRFPRSAELTRKDLMVTSLRSLQKAVPALGLATFLPTTFLLPEEFDKYRDAWKSESPTVPWIIKPRASAQGRGMYIAQHPRDVEPGRSCVICKYIPRPLLLDGYKSDVRLYVVVTSFDPLRVYLYHDGMVRLATSKYDLSKKGLTNPYAHLTNYSVNKKSSNFVSASHSAGNMGFKRSLTSVLAQLEAQGRDAAGLMDRIEAVVLKAVCSVEPAVSAACRSLFKHGDVSCAEMLGFDILIDEDLNPWLLEVNASPSIATDSPLDTRLKTGALVGFLNLVRIPPVSPDRRRQGNTPTAASDTVSPPTPSDILRAVMEEADIAESSGYVRLAPDIDRAHRYLPFVRDTSGHNAALHDTLVSIRSSFTPPPTEGASSRSSRRSTGGDPGSRRYGDGRGTVAQAPTVVRVCDAWPYRHHHPSGCDGTQTVAGPCLTPGGRVDMSHQPSTTESGGGGVPMDHMDRVTTTTRLEPTTDGDGNGTTSIDAAASVLNSIRQRHQSRQMHTHESSMNAHPAAGTATPYADTGGGVANAGQGHPGLTVSTSSPPIVDASASVAELNATLDALALRHSRRSVVRHTATDTSRGD
eukprot:m.13914 g.13914  ORF g.13914 m.13914 type:complete len:720 (+) comp3102_c0_seq1:230-2389(+)